MRVEQHRFIPARGYEPKSRRSAHKNYPHGWYRTRMFLDFDSGTYALRSLVETVNSMIKRKTGEIVFEKTLASMAREIKFACIAHNVRLLIDSGLVRI